MATRVFQIALVSKLNEQEAPWFNYQAKNVITYTLWEHLVPIAIAPLAASFPAPAGSTPPPSCRPTTWSSTSSAIPPRASHAALASREMTAPTAGGLTAQASGGVVCEVYVDGNMPAPCLANIAFHEIMHIKLDVGARVIADLHTKGGGGLASPPTNEWKPLTPRKIELMAANLFRKVPQYTKAM